MKSKPLVLAITVSVLLFHSVAFSAVVNFTPRLSLNEEYTDNVDSNDQSKSDDYITTISPGFSLETLQKHNGLSLDYTAAYAMYRENSKDDTWRHNAGLSFMSDLSKHTHFEIRDNFLRTEESTTTDVFGTPLPDGSIIEPDTTARRGRNPFSTNATSTSLSHQFGERDTIAFKYLYSFRKDDAPDGNDNNRHVPGLSLSYWFTPQWGIDSHVDYTRADFSNSTGLNNSTDFDDWLGSLKLSRMLTKQLSVFVSHSHIIRDFKGDQESDYTLDQPSIGFSYDFTKDMGVTLGVGYFRQNIDESKDETGSTFNADINKTWAFQRGQIRLVGSAGLDRNEFGTENLGLERFYGAAANASYSWTKRISTSLNSTFRRNEALNDTVSTLNTGGQVYSNKGRIDDRVSIGGGLTYTLTRWLLLRTSYNHNIMRSDIDLNDYDENIVTLGVTLVPERPYRYNW